MTDKEAIEDIIDTSLKEKSRGVCTISVEYLENIEKYLQTQQEEIERLKKTELKTKGGGVKVTLEGLVCLETKILDLETELNKKDTLINTMQAEFERLENLEDNTDMLKEELKKKDKIIDEMAEEIIRILYYCDGKIGKYKTPYVEESISKTYENIKEYFINKVEKENKDDN